MEELEIHEADELSDGQKYNPNSQRALDEARDHDLTVIFPQPNQLLIDLDSVVAYETFLRNLHYIERFFGVKAREEHVSRHGFPRRHVTLTLDIDLNDTERTLLQACLGSDLERELLALVQIRNNDPHPILFLEEKK